MTIRITFLPESNKRILRIFLNLNKKTIYSQVSDIHRQARPWLPCELLYAIYIYITRRNFPLFPARTEL